MMPEDKQIRIFRRFPHKVLDLFCKVLPDNTRDWSYHTGDVLAKLLKAEPRLAKDQRFADLRRRQAQAL